MGSVLAPDGLGRFFNPLTVWIYPKTPKTQARRSKSPFYSVRRSCSGLCSGFTVVSPIFQTKEKDRVEKADSHKTIDSIDDLQRKHRTLDGARDGS